MRTVITKTPQSPSIYLAIESGDAATELQSQFSQLGCRCSHLTDIASFEQMLCAETPSMAVVSLDLAGVSLDLAGQSALQFCQDHPRLLDEIPVAFFAQDCSRSFEQALEAIRLGALDVLVLPLGAGKLERLAFLAQQKPKSWQPAEAEFFVSNVPYVNQRIPAKAPLKIPACGLESDLEKTSPFSPTQETSPRKSQPQASPGRPFSALADPSGQTTTNGSFDNPRPPAEALTASHAARIQELESWILGSSRGMQQVRSIIAEVAETKANVMIYGASGTGKEMVATAVHKLSNRCDGPFEPINMTEIPHDLAESLLFGHEKGSFTGADNRQIGVCEAADGGTLFLDEIGEMALGTQPKLLRFLQEGTVRRVGSRKFKQVDVRVITATNRCPDTIVQSGRMREDLFFRLHVVPIHIPPLHERTEDIEQLATLFLNRYVKAYGRSVKGFTGEVLEIFRRHDWPGNVRQLENVMERLVVFAKGQLIEVPDIPAEIHASSMFDNLPSRMANHSFFGSGSPAFASPEAVTTAGHDHETAQAVASMSAIQRTERSAIIEALQLADGHVIDASNLLGLGQATVYRKIKQYHIPHQRRRRRRTPK